MENQFVIISILLFFLLSFYDTLSQSNQVEDSLSFNFISEISYKDGPSDYEKERCKLDLYIPKGKEYFPVIVWFPGGGLKLGDKCEDHATIVAKAFAGKGIGVALINYRLNPKVKYPEYIWDASAAVKWVFSNISKYGGDTKKIFIGGQSAGAFLTYMLGLNEEYLEKNNIMTNQIAGLVPVSSQVFCHSTIREEMGIEEEKVINHTCPLYYIHKSAPPILCLLAEEDEVIDDNKLLIEKLKKAGYTNCELNIIPKRDHMSLVMEMRNQDDPALLEIVDFIETIKKNIIKKNNRY